MMDATLNSTRLIDADSPVVRAFTAKHAGAGSDIQKAVRLYYAVRDAIPYSMFAFGIDQARFMASNVLGSTSAFCVPKAVALAAVARAAGIASRIGFADVRNHLVPDNALALMEGDLFRWHAYTALFLDGNWVKATPAFNIELCQRHGVTPLDFDGREDSIFHPYDQAGRQHMEYVRFHGEFDDMPLDRFGREMRRHYPRMLAALKDNQTRKAG
ncbi:MAG: hypothetical protein L0H83_12855 [Salinisphaera sp.]|nr:hypothetical protein [Salinisphaera sp.]